MNIFCKDRDKHKYKKKTKTKTLALELKKNTFDKSSYLIKVLSTEVHLSAASVYIYTQVLGVPEKFPEKLAEAI